MKTYFVIGMNNETISKHKSAKAAFTSIAAEKRKFAKSGMTGYLPRSVVCGNNYSFFPYSTTAHGPDVVEENSEYDEDIQEYAVVGYVNGAGNSHK